MNGPGLLLPGGLPVPGVRKVPVAPGGGGWAPDDAAGLVAWYKADAITGKVDGDPISQWDDSSGDGRHLVQATGAKQPLYKTNILNGLPAVRFDGTDDFLAHLAGAPYISGTALTLAIVHIRRGFVDFARQMAVHNSLSAEDYDSVSDFIVYNGSTDGINTYRSSGPLTSQTGIANGAAMLNLVWFDGTHANHRYNGAAASPTPAGAVAGSFRIDHLIVGGGWGGGVAANFTQSDFCEVMLWDNDIGSTERTNLETYTDRWGL